MRSARIGKQKFKPHTFADTNRSEERVERVFSALSLRNSASQRLNCSLISLTAQTQRKRREKCASVVKMADYLNHKDTENAEEAQRRTVHLI